MRKIACYAFLAIFYTTSFSQQKPAAASTIPPTVKEEKKQSSDIPFNPDASTSSMHEVTIKGQKVSYKATVGTMPVWDEDGKTIAGLFILIMKELM
jgi:carboxypeptidase C (cathepsin A)